MVQMAQLLDDSERQKRLKMACDRMGGTAKLGRMLGYTSGSYVSQMISGERPITEKTIKALLDIPKVADLFSWNANTGFRTAENEPMPAPQPIGGETERRLTRFLAVLYQLPEDQRASALLIATEVLLDHLPPPPTQQPAAPARS